MSERSEAEELRASRARLVRAEDEERRAIERDLHDGLQQQLVAIGVNLQLAQQLAPADTADLRAVLEELEAIARDALDDARQLAARIHPAVLDGRGLIGALRVAADALGVPTVIEGAAGPLSPSVAVVVFLCCREALANVGRHAGPGAHATIVLHRDGDAVRFQVTDDGAGFDVERERTGLDRLQVRVESLGGDLQVESHPGRGTRITATVYSASAR